MEIGNSNLFSQEHIYGDQVEKLMELLNENPNKIKGEVEEAFKDAIFKQIETIRKADKFHLPSFGEGFQWLNTSRAVSFEELKNKIYVMDFFTYCCINCIHILPILKEVENIYSDDHRFAVIGIHSPKFSNEKNLYRVKEAVIRNNIEHPVLNDSQCKLWKSYGVSCWPTVFIVGPGHDLLFVLAGETQIDKLPFLCSNVFNYYTSCEIQMDVQPLPVSPINEERNEADMLFPGSVSTNGDLIAVSDTGNNRLLLMSRSFTLKETIGSGSIGCQDGPFNLASFNSPHGTAWYKDALYVADTGNHSIRKVCFKSKAVITVFSRNVCIIDMDDVSTAEADFKSPWDVCVGPELNGTRNVLYIAAAGSHQIFELYLEGYKETRYSICVPFAGSGKEENRQNLYRLKAGFAQPSGITYSSRSPDHLFVADSESSTIKSISVRNGAVKILVGGGRDPSDLFQFGDKDGKHIDVKLQHPMGICVLREDLLAIADTYNHKIKLVSIFSKECTTYNTNLNLCEPSGMCVIGDTLVVSDTNNHRIVPIRMPDKISDWVPEQFDKNVDIAQHSPNTTVDIGYSTKLFCYFHVTPSSDYEFNETGSQEWDVSFEGELKLKIVHKSQNMCGDKQPSLILQPSSDVKDRIDVSEVTITGILPFCDKKLNVCCFKKISFKVIVNVLKEHLFESVCVNFNAVVDRFTPLY